MLADLGMGSLEDLFAHVPKEIRLQRPLALEKGRSEFEVREWFSGMARRNSAARRDLVIFAGGGAYDHDLSSAARALGGQSAFVTAYTPYQPEVSQGVLQALFEYQTLVARIFGTDVANASLYDGAAALVEAVNLAVGATGSNRVIASGGVNPAYLETLATFGAGRSLELEVAATDEREATAWGALSGQAAAVVVGYPNYFGTIEDIAKARALANDLGALLVVVADPVALGLLEAPGALGADIVVGEGQSLGIPLSFGGPYLGLFGASSRYLRLIPGRLVGETVDADGRTAFVTTLRTREQDIRRERATSNVCTNQTLMAIQAAIHLSWLGKEGYREVSRRCYNAAHYLASRLETIGLRVSSAPFFREFVVELPVPAEAVRSRLFDQGFLAGLAVRGRPNHLLLTATETHTREEIDRFSDLIAKEV